VRHVYGRTAAVTLKVDTAEPQWRPLATTRSRLRVLLRQAVAEGAIRLRGPRTHIVYADQPTIRSMTFRRQRLTDIVALARDQRCRSGGDLSNVVSHHDRVPSGPTTWFRSGIARCTD